MPVSYVDVQELRNPSIYFDIVVDEQEHQTQQILVHFADDVDFVVVDFVVVDTDVVKRKIQRSVPELRRKKISVPGFDSLQLQV